MVVCLYWVVITLPCGASEQKHGPAVTGGFLVGDAVGCSVVMS